MPNELKSRDVDQKWYLNTTKNSIFPSDCKLVVHIATTLSPKCHIWSFREAMSAQYIMRSEGRAIL